MLSGGNWLNFTVSHPAMKGREISQRRSCKSDSARLDGNGHPIRGCSYRESDRARRPSTMMEIAHFPMLTRPGPRPSLLPLTSFPCPGGHTGTARGPLVRWQIIGDPPSRAAPLRPATPQAKGHCLLLSSESSLLRQPSAAKPSPVCTRCR